ncbi:MAG: type I restriction enzyme HsdR N-terminal domain-containing protein [Cyanobacteriota bacterium]|jgi:hypothetical protein
MAKVLAVTEAVKSLAQAESRFGLRPAPEEAFFSEWRGNLPELTGAELTHLQRLRERLLYHRAGGDLLEGSVMLLAASPLLELAGLYDPPFRMRAEAAIEVTVDDGEEVLRGRIDVLILQGQLWALVVESKKTTIPTRSALPQALAYLLASPQSERPLFGLLINGDDVLFVKLTQQPERLYGLSRAFSLYTLASEWREVLRVLKKLAGLITES